MNLTNFPVANQPMKTHEDLCMTHENLCVTNENPWKPIFAHEKPTKTYEYVHNPMKTNEKFRTFTFFSSTLAEDIRVKVEAQLKSLKKQKKKKKKKDKEKERDESESSESSEST